LNPQECWEIFEKISAYVSGEIEGEEAREAERLILEDPEKRCLAESYSRMLAAFSTLAEKSPHGSRGPRHPLGLPLGVPPADERPVSRMINRRTRRSGTNRVLVGPGG
jgi:anti-sigma factor RsiW